MQFNLKTISRAWNATAPHANPSVSPYSDASKKICVRAPNTMTVSIFASTMSHRIEDHSSEHLRTKDSTVFNVAKSHSNGAWSIFIRHFTVAIYLCRAWWWRPAVTEIDFYARIYFDQQNDLKCLHYSPPVTSQMSNTSLPSLYASTFFAFSPRFVS